ncbi:hypothetical protein K458DRAFT_423401 [Lentithecium fluviatile CBS 122367]|uniref:5'-3' DNA helicase ZGRF1-like N-terminal domain-containing protein n=1 Tax=Lentithecium fluviatile CBS 122367 TaxID=1168545 RepID=A0A6G1IJF3_9PLEO|nr:hypothetical protein K458DRAFT_423401 [Lentithecium fluviatile CBS 122367]
MALRGTPRLSGVPASQNTAPVNEYRCLFTSDLRRKQKRWQDGYLKFHTFNSRVMVYDTSRNFLGDTYWKEPNEVQEGDELTLDKGIMVQVAEPMGVTQTDLTPLLERKKESPQRNNAGPMPRTLPKPAVPATNALRARSQLRHKSLNMLLGTPKGPIGKAAPMRSPFEMRKEKENQFAEERASKRQKTAHSPTADNGPASNKTVPLWARISDAKTNRAPPRPLPRPAAVINFDSEPDHFSSDVTLPSTPLGMVKPASRPKVTSVPVSNHGETRDPQAFATPRIPKGKVPVSHVKAQETPRPPLQPSSPPISASNRISNVDIALQPVRNRSTSVDVAVEPVHSRPAKLNLTTAQPVSNSPNQPSQLQSPPRNPKAKSLRLSIGVKRGMLLCQSGLPPKSRASKSPNRLPKPQEAIRHVSLLGDIIHVISDDETTQQAEPSKSCQTGSRLMKKRTGQSVAVASDSRRVNIESSPQPSLGSLDDMEFIHGLMDQQLMVTPSPTRARVPTKTTSLVPRTTSAKKARGKRKRTAESSPKKPASKPKKTKTVTAKEGGVKPRAKKKQVEMSQASPQESPSASPILEPPEELPQNQFVPRIEATDERPRTASASLSPTTKLALSTGGFRKKPKRAQPQLTPAKPDAPTSHPVTVALPPHPLRANQSGSLMSTTELSALLQKPNRPVCIEDDPIEDGSQKPSPNKSFQRSRSENDAPIPSASEEWVLRNLPKISKPSTGNASAAKPEAAPPKPKAGGLAALVKKTDPRRKFQRTQSLNADTNVPNNAEVEAVTPPPDHDVGPWSTEAFDLLDWRPPNMEGGEDGIGTFIDG